MFQNNKNNVKILKNKYKKKFKKIKNYYYFIIYFYK